MTSDVLGIDVPDGLLGQWRGWLMPVEQPFLVPPGTAAAAGLADGKERLSLELTDAFSLWGTGDRVVCWLTRAGSRQLPPQVRHSQPDAHRWPSADRARDITRVIRWVEEGRRRSCHTEVSQATWQEVSGILPAARRLAGTFPPGSGPNCFGTVMGAAGVAGAAATWMGREPFEQWLAAETDPGGRDSPPGTVLVWRSGDQAVQHAAVTLGDGWALHKPSQGWMSPVKVLPVRGAIYSSRARGLHLQRRTPRG